MFEMDKMGRFNDRGIRISDAPRGSPKVTAGERSPVRSVHPAMASGNSQPGLTHSTMESWFEDASSEEDIDGGDHGHPLKPPSSGSRMGIKRSSGGKDKPGNYLGATPDQFHSQCEGNRVSSPSAVKQYLNSNPYIPFGDPNSLSSGASSLLGSVRELDAEQARHAAAHMGGVRASLSPPHSSIEAHDGEDDSPVLPQADRKDRILDVHRTTLQALLRDENALAQSMTPPPLSVLRPKRHTSQGLQDPRYRSSSAPVRKVAVVPPPIDTLNPNRFCPDEVVRTPYPLQRAYRKDFVPSPLSNLSSAGRLVDNVLTISIRRSNTNSAPRISTIIIPATPGYASSSFRAAPSTEKEKYFQADFDDAEFFRQLYTQYRNLSGRFRYFSARSLRRVVVSGPASRAADNAYGWLHAPRSPRDVAWRGLSDTFSEEKIMKHLRDPESGKARYAWVSWAHRLAAAPRTQSLQTETPDQSRLRVPGTSTESKDLIRQSQQHEGLEFVMSWSAKRITAALAIVIMLSVTAMLLWIFLGTSERLQETTGLASTVDVSNGFRNAGERVGSGVVIGICVLLVGLIATGGWIGMSWLLL